MNTNKHTDTMKWLLRREFWEHKGSMFWAPLIVGALLVVLMGSTITYGIMAHGVRQGRDAVRRRPRRRLAPAAGRPRRNPQSLRRRFVRRNHERNLRVNTKMSTDTSANTMKWLLRREFWEHKGSMFWTPVGVGA